MPKYYLVRRTNFAGFHSVHKEGCPFLQSVNRCIELGEFDSSCEAIWQARGIYTNSNACIFCVKESVATNAEHLFEWNMFSTS